MKKCLEKELTFHGSKKTFRQNQKQKKTKIYFKFGRNELYFIVSGEKNPQDRNICEVNISKRDLAEQLTCIFAEHTVNEANIHGKLKIME